MNSLHSEFIGPEKLIGNHFEPKWDKDNKFEVLTIDESQRENIRTSLEKIDASKEYVKNEILIHEQRKKFIRESKYSRKRKEKIPTNAEKKKKIQTSLEKAIELEKRGYSLDYITSILSVTKSQICNAKYKESLGLSPEYRGKSKPNRFNNMQLSYLKSLLEENIERITFFNYKDFLIPLTLKFEEFKSNPPVLTTIIKAVNKLGYSKRSLRRRNESYFKDKILSERKNIAFLLSIAHHAKKEIVYIDECGFNCGLSPLKGIVSKKNPRYLPCQTKGQNISVICAINKKEILGIQLFSTAVKGKDFSCFLINLINNSERLKSNLRNTYFFMDNATIHKSKIAKGFFENINILYNAPYSPDLNPIENLFGRVKKVFRDLNLKRQDDILINIINSFKSVSSLNLYNYVVHSMKFYEKAINLQAF